MPKFVWRWIINGVALYIAALVVPGIFIEGDWVTLVVIAAIFGIINAFIGPVLKVLSCPLIVLTLGLFTLVINAGLLLLTSWVSQSLGLGFRVDGFVPALLGGLLIAVVSAVLSLFLRDTERSHWGRRRWR